MLAKVRQTIAQHNLLSKGSRVVVAVSGGIDSVVMLHVLHNLRKDYNLEVLVAHLNHGFRGEESRGDAAFVEKLAQKYGLPYVSKEISVPDFIAESGQSPQEAARNVRYSFLEKVRQQFNGTAIAVGQNANDQAETVLINLLRGGAGSGLKGIPIKRSYLIRPLLDVKRSEIEEYAEQHHLAYRFDSSNAKSVYLRNRIRIELLPELEQKYNPMIIANLGKTAAILAEEDKLLTTMAKESLLKCLAAKNELGIVIDLKQFAKENLAIKRRVIRLICQEIKGLESFNIGFEHVEQVIKLTELNTGAKVEMPGKLIFMKQYHRLYAGQKEQLKLLEETEPIGTELMELKVPGRTVIPKANLSLEANILDKLSPVHYEKPILPNSEIRFDWDKVKSEKLFIRGRKAGDWIKPFGMNGSSKKIKDFFIDLKIPRVERDKIPLLVTQEGEVLWIIGFRTSESFRITNDTEKMLVITLS